MQEISALEAAWGVEDVVGGWACSDQMRWHHITVEALKSGPLDAGLGTEGWRRDGAPSTISPSQVDLASVGELQSEKEGSKTSHVGSFHDAPFRSSTPRILLMLCLPADHSRIQTSAHSLQGGRKGGARHSGVRSCCEVRVL